MQVTFREINYKTVEVPDGTSIEELNAMVTNCDIVIGDTTDTDYSVSLDNCKTWVAVAKEEIGEVMEDER